MAANIQSLTALRGLAALTVLTYHCAEPIFGGVAHVPLPLSHSFLAVDLFFLLSGFVLMHVHEREFGDGVAWTNVKSFLRARFARTYPVHLAMLIVLLPLYGMRPEYSGIALVHSLLLTQGPWLGEICWNVPAWSVSAEWHAYLLFPFLVLPWRRTSKRVAVAILLMCVTTLCLAAFASNNWDHNTYTPVILLRCLSEFIAGMGLSHVYREGWLRKWMTGDQAVVASAIAVVGFSSFAHADVAVIVALAFLLLACAHNQNRAARLLTTGLPMFLGRISYSLYMVQTIAGDAAYVIVKPWLTTHGAGGVVDAALMVVLSFAFAIPLSRYIEYPMRDWLRGRAVPPPPPASIHVLATVDGEGRAGDEARLVGDQK
jgi:peptidoglycan/LPS O-acetylase OafA/YrhL